MRIGFIFGYTRGFIFVRYKVSTKDNGSLYFRLIYQSLELYPGPLYIYINIQARIQTTAMFALANLKKFTKSALRGNVVKNQGIIG